MHALPQQLQKGGSTGAALAEDGADAAEIHGVEGDAHGVGKNFVIEHVGFGFEETLLIDFDGGSVDDGCSKILDVASAFFDDDDVAHVVVVVVVVEGCAALAGGVVGGVVAARFFLVAIHGVV